MIIASRKIENSRKENKLIVQKAKYRRLKNDKQDPHPPNNELGVISGFCEKKKRRFARVSIKPMITPIPFGRKKTGIVV